MCGSGDGRPPGRRECRGRRCRQLPHALVEWVTMLIVSPECDVTARLLGACHAQSADLAVVASGRHRVVRRLAAAGGQVELHLQTKSGTMDCSGLPGRR